MNPSPTRKRRNSTVALSTASSHIPQLREYLRQSIGDDRNEGGIKVQDSICARWYAANASHFSWKWEDCVKYEDDGLSRDDPTRPDFLRLMQDIGPGDLVLIWDRSRLGVALQYAQAVQDIYDKGAQVVITSTGEMIDMANEMAGLVEVLHGFNARSYVKTLRRLTTDKLRARVRDGYAASNLPYGLETYPENPSNPKKSRKLGRVVESEAAVVVRIAEMYAAGHGPKHISAVLTREGVPTSTPPERARKRKRRAYSGAWCSASVRQILRNPTYRGVYVYGVAGGKGGRITPITMAHNEWKIGSDELWARVDARIAAADSSIADNFNAAAHPLSGGIGRCSECGGSLYVQTDGRPGRRKRTYQCSRSRGRLRGVCANKKLRVDAQELEMAVSNGLIEWFDAAERAVSDAVRKVEERLAAQAAPDVSAIARELETARIEQARLARAVATTNGAIDALMEALKTGQAHVKSLEAALTRAEAPWTDVRLIGRQIEAEARKRLEALRAGALDGSAARPLLGEIFPDGIMVSASPEAVTLAADGVLTTESISVDTYPVIRLPFSVTIPRKAA